MMVLPVCHDSLVSKKVSRTFCYHLRELGMRLIATQQSRQLSIIVSFLFSRFTPQRFDHKIVTMILISFCLSLQASLITLFCLEINSFRYSIFD